MTILDLCTLAISLNTLRWMNLIVSVFFVFCFGGICGSFINVIVHRLPLGLSVVRPPSACPQCSTKLAWRDNFPVFGWIFLRGKCRYCKNPISAEYPIVEFIVAMLFVVTYVLWFADAHTLRGVGLDPTLWRPEWARDGIARMWPIAILFAALFFSLVAITLIDAKTFHIPLVIPWMLAAFALVVHPLSAWWIGARGGLGRSPHEWVIPIVGWPLLGLSIGGAIGLIISTQLVRMRLLPRSFADYEEWEKANTPDVPAKTAESTEEPTERGSAVLRALFFAGPIVAGLFAGLALGLRLGNTNAFVAFGAGIGMLVGLLLRSLVPDGERNESDPAWIFYPHARREMCKECLFLLLPAILGAVGYFMFQRAGTPPLWLGAFGGSLFGLLVGGGTIWAIRIGGSLAFGKEAMGAGDVHLMAGVGAVLGWIDPTIAFFVAPFIGISWAIGAQVVSMLKKDGESAPKALPYGPHLAIATVLVVLGKPIVEIGLSLIMSKTINLP